MAQSIRSMSSGSRPARSIAWRPARTANCEVYSPGAAFRRCLIPVRVVIQSSEVSTIVSRSLLVNSRGGTYVPSAVIFALTSGRKLLVLHLLRLFETYEAEE